MTPNEPVPAVTGIVFSQSDSAHAPWLRAALARRPEMSLVEEVSTTSEAVRAAERRRPQLVILDLGAGPASGCGVVRDVRRVAPDARIVVPAGVAAQDDAPGARRWVNDIVAAVLDPERRPGLQARLTLPDQPRSVPDARSFVTDLLVEWDLEEYVEPVKLVASELVANSVLHVRGSCALELICETAVLRLAVADADPTAPTVQVLSDAAECGRGLHLVSAFSSAWGVDPLADGGKVVWAELAPAPTGVS